MGITGLLPFLKEGFAKANVKKFSGSTVAIDAHGWLYKGSYGCAVELGRGLQTTAYITYCMQYVNLLLAHNIKPILVFDGKKLPSKGHTNEKRKKDRDEKRTAALLLFNQGMINEARTLFQQCITVTPTMARAFIKELRSKNIDYIVSPYEADAQLAFLARKGIADLVITDDGDLIVFGCPRVFYKMDINGDGNYFEKSKIQQCLGVNSDQYTFERFRWMCILSGCDYLPSIPGIGLVRAKTVIFSSSELDLTKIVRSIPKVLNTKQKKYNVPQGYLEGFIRAENTFLYQLVFDTITRTVIPLTPYPSNIDSTKLDYAGVYQNSQLAIGLSLGNVDVESLDTVDHFDPLKSGYTDTSIWSPSYKPKYGPTEIESSSSMEKVGAEKTVRSKTEADDLKEISSVSTLKRQRLSKLTTEDNLSLSVPECDTDDDEVYATSSARTETQSSSSSCNMQCSESPGTPTTSKVKVETVPKIKTNRKHNKMRL